MSANNTKTGVLLVNLGTPDSPSKSDVGRYLTEFLTDPRVIDIPWLWRQLLVRVVIVPKRAGESARTYAKIWTDKGSPLKYIGEELTELLDRKLNETGHRASEGGPEYCVRLAMRYQNPSIPDVLERMRAENIDRYIILPLFPQYASATTGSVHQKVMETVQGWQTVPQLSFINSYPVHEGFVDAFAQIGGGYDIGGYDHILFSFHGLPERQLQKADLNGHCLKSPDCCRQLTEKNRYCYGAQCNATAQALTKRLGIPSEKYTICYQSRLGKEPWIQPYVTDVLHQLAEKGAKKVLVFCPAFVADCIETLYEISVEYQEEFVALGGEKVQLVESLNTHPRWVDTLADLVRSN